MADGKGECCIARWGEGHVAVSGYNNPSSKMDMIMLKFRPIAPKPVAGSTATAEGGSPSNASAGGRHAKGGRGRKKTNSKENNNNNNNNNSSSKRCTSGGGRKRKSSSPDDKNNLVEINNSNNNEEQKSDLTLLPLFPEEPDLSPTNHQMMMDHNYYGNDNMMMKMPFSSVSLSSSLAFENNYNQCHSSWW